MTNKLQKKYKIQTRGFSVWSQVVCLLYAQITRASSLNEVCDALSNHTGKLGVLRGAKAPSRNGLSNANRTRNSNLIEELFWKTYEHLQNINPQFANSGKFSQFPKKFCRKIYAIDSSTLELVHNCIDWAKHRRRKAAAKLHMSLCLNNMLPKFAIVEEAAHHDSQRARAVCENLKAGEVAIFDRAYVDFEHLLELTGRGVFWVLRSKKNMQFTCRKKRLKKETETILRDDEVLPKNKNSRQQYPQCFRKIQAWVEVDGHWMLMTFITNNMDWAPSSICDLYRSRWAVESFFKQLKQNLQLGSFLGHNKHAIRWQIWAALLVYLLVRFQAFLSSWACSFSRLISLIRGVVWDGYDLLGLLNFYGIASGEFSNIDPPQEQPLRGFEEMMSGTA